MFERALELIKKYETIIIHRHTNPDGDAIGSQVGLKHLIRDNFPSKTVLAVGDPAKRYSFMEDSVMDEVSDEQYRGALAVVLDTSSPELICDDRYTQADATLRLDHHIFIDKICDVEVIDTSFESCCGLITMLAKKCELALTPTSAKLLYTGMVTDSGRFRYDSTTSQTFEMAAHLMKQGFSTGDIFSNLYVSDFESILRRARHVLKIQFTEHRVAYVYTTAQEVAEMGCDTFTVSRGLVNTMSEIQGTDIWVNFTECEAGVLCEIRSVNHNINIIATKYGGGGHLKASGATVKDRAQAMEMLADLDAIAGGSYNG